MNLSGHSLLEREDHHEGCRTSCHILSIFILLNFYLIIFILFNVILFMFILFYRSSCHILSYSYLIFIWFIFTYLSPWRLLQLISHFILYLPFSFNRFFYLFITMKVVAALVTLALHQVWKSNQVQPPWRQPKSYHYLWYQYLKISKSIYIEFQ